jgi:hypothetical protein
MDKIGGRVINGFRIDFIFMSIHRRKVEFVVVREEIR